MEIMRGRLRQKITLGKCEKRFKENDYKFNGKQV